MEPTVLGVVLDSSVLIAAERRKLNAADAIESIQKRIGDLPLALSVVTIAEIGHGIYRTNMPDIRERRRLFLDELKATIPIYPVMEPQPSSLPALVASKPRRVLLFHWAI